MARKRKSKARGTRQGKALTDVQREGIIQMYAITGNKTETARSLGVAVSTVYNVLREANARATHEVRKARQMATQDLAGRAHHAAEKILDSIGPADVESGRIVQKDEDGNITNVKLWGPSLLQKVTAVGILTDKTKTLQDLQEQLALEAGSANAMPLPADVDSAIAQIASKVKRLRLLDVHFEDSQPESITEKLQDEAIRQALRETPDPEPIEAEFTVIDDFDGE
jgi:hypothetical protein